MNEEVKSRWLEKLRSGDYAQTPGQLGFVADDGSESYCCLGVLCEIAVEDGIVSRTVSDNGSIYYHDGKYDMVQMHVLTSGVIEWSGIDDANPEIDTEGFDVLVDGDSRSYASLSELNDYANWNFSQIADFIDDKL
jgi:hypothetical protein